MGAWVFCRTIGIALILAVVPPQNPVDRTIVDVTTLGVKLAYPHASLGVRPARDRQSALILVKPETMIGWHRKGFKRSH